MSISPESQAIIDRANQQAMAGGAPWLQQHLPGGKVEGGEYVCSDLHGGAGDSCKVNIGKGVWSDFATGDAGGDRVSLVAAIRGCQQLEAARMILGLPAWEPGGGRATGELRMAGRRVEAGRLAGDAAPEPGTVVWTPIIPVPDGAPEAVCPVLRGAEYAAHWAYRTEDGKLIGYMIRYARKDGKKDYRPMGWCQASNGERDWRLAGFPLPRPLYGLETLAAGIGTVHVTEGEKAADALRILKPGAVVLTWPHGAKSVDKADWSPLRDREVVIWPDADAPGLSAAKDIVELLPQARIVDVGTGRPDGWDAADALAEGMPPEELEALLANLLPVVPTRASRLLEYLDTPLEVVPDEEAVRLFIPRSDVENSIQFAAVLKDSARYCPDVKKWLVWDRAGWQWNRTGGVVEKAKKYALAIERGCLEISDPKQRAAAMEKAIEYARSGSIKSVIDLAKSDPRVATTMDMLDPDPWRVGVIGGSMDLRTGEFTPPDPSLLVTKRLGTAFDASAQCPVWLRFLDRVVPDPVLQRYIRALAGYSLTGLTEEHCFLFLYGSGSNGKTTLIEALHALFGDYAQTAPESMLALNPYGTEPKANLARLPGVRFLSGSEVSQGMRMNEALIKMLTGGDTITAEAKYCDPFDLHPVMKLWMFGNHRPVIQGSDDGIWRRVRLIPFTQSIPDGEKDKKLPTKLRAELAGILNWALEGLRDWRENGFVLPETVSKATDDYREASDTIGLFFAEHLKEAPECRVLIKDVYQKYEDWCEEEGIKHPLAARTFNTRLEDRGFVKAKLNGDRKWLGLAFQPVNEVLRD